MEWREWTEVKKDSRHRQQQRWQRDNTIWTIFEEVAFIIETKAHPFWIYAFSKSTANIIHKPFWQWAQHTCLPCSRSRTVTHSHNRGRAPHQPARQTSNRRQTDDSRTAIIIIIIMYLTRTTHKPIREPAESRGFCFCLAWMQTVCWCVSWTGPNRWVPFFCRGSDLWGSEQQPTEWRTSMSMTKNRKEEYLSIQPTIRLMTCNNYGVLFCSTTRPSNRWAFFLLLLFLWRHIYLNSGCGWPDIWLLFNISCG